jgi:DNA-binding CsgD family transcriptional regulator
MADRALTPRERELLAALATGASYRQIAARLAVTETTVKGYMRLLRQKLGAQNGPHAVHIAHTRGLLGPSTSASTAVHKQTGGA